MRMLLAAVPLVLAAAPAAAETTVAQFESNLWNAMLDSGDGLFVNAVRTVGDGGQPLTYVAYADFDLVWHDDTTFTATGVFASGYVAGNALTASSREARLSVAAGALAAEVSVYECTLIEGEGMPTCEVTTSEGTSPAISLSWSAGSNPTSREVGTVSYGSWPVTTRLSGNVTETDAAVTGTIGDQSIDLLGHLGTLHRAWVSITRQ